MNQVSILAPIIFTDRIAKESKKSYRAADVQGFVVDRTGRKQVFQLMLMAPYGEQGVDQAPGVYEPVTELRVNKRDNMRLEFSIVGFRAAAGVAAAPAAATAKA